MIHEARYWTRLDDGRIQCDLCPRHCRLREGQRAFCFVRKAEDGQLTLTTYGRSTGFCIDPIEKKPLNHFLPGTPVLSFGTAGCNLGCRYCQNWDSTRSRATDRMTEVATPAAIARAAAATGCRSVAFTYNDPVIWAEYAIDTAVACHERGVRTVAVTAGYITELARSDFFRHIDAANVDLKAMDGDFYERLCFAKLEPVLETLAWLAESTDVWVEVTTLLIPGENDGDADIERLVAWFAEHMGPDVPLHFSAFHPDFKMTSVPRTPASTLTRAREIALAHGLKYVYLGNTHDRDGDTTFCPGCGRPAIVRDWYRLVEWNLEGSCCKACGHAIAGVFEDAPGGWGARRSRIDVTEFA